MDKTDVPSNPECNSNLPSALLHLISLAPSKVECDRMNIYCGSWLWKVGEKQSGEKLVSPFLAWLTLRLAASNSFREGQVPLLLLPAQVYDNPNKLWCAIQTLEALIGTKSNRPCLSGQRAERVAVCALPCSPFPTINFSLSSNLTSLQGYLLISLALSSCLLLSRGSNCKLLFLFCALSVQLSWRIYMTAKTFATQKEFCVVVNCLYFFCIPHFVFPQPFTGLVFISFAFIFMVEWITRLTPTTLILPKACRPRTSLNHIC